MIQRARTIRQVANAALYFTLRGRTKSGKRIFIALESLGMALVIGLTVLLQTYLQISPATITLDSATYNLIGESRDDTAQYLTENNQNSSFDFTVPKTEESSASVHTGRVTDAYAASLPKRASEGISLTDTTSNISISLAPKFRTGEGRKVDGDHIVYPLGAQKLIYTLKYNGLKEDIVVPEYLTDELTYEFELRLPTGVEARMDNAGNIGIYSADPTLYGNISFGSDEDRERIDKARENGEKTNLVMTIPAPIIKDANGKEHTDKSSFELGEKKQVQREASNQQSNLPPEVAAQSSLLTAQNTYNLSIKSKNLRDLAYPIAIDPTIQVPSAGDFGHITPEGGAALDGTSIKRSALTGGTLDAWSNIAGETLPAARISTAGVAHNGYMYIVGGSTSTEVRFSKIQADGSLISPAVGSCSGVWCTTLPIQDNGNSHNVIAYNGYMYKLGCNCIDAKKTMQYAKINANGTLSNPVNPATLTWQTTTNVVANGGALMGAPAVVVNGWMYLMGGTNPGSGTAAYDTVVRASINGDGSLGAWTSEGVFNLPEVRRYGSAAQYNGRLYFTGGGTTVTGTTTTVYHVALNTDGSMKGTGWLTSANSMQQPNGRGAHATHIVNGYIYAVAGFTNGSPTTAITSSVEYAQINADGSVGTWRMTNSLSAGNRYGFASGVQDNWLYVTGGCGLGSCTSSLASTIRTQIEPAGELHNATFTNNANNFDTNGSFYHTSVATQGRLYVFGGCQTDQCTTVRTMARFATIAANGSIGAFNSMSNAMPAARFGHASFVYNNFIYVVGGCASAASGVCDSPQNNTYYTELDASGNNPGGWGNDTTNPFTDARYGHTAVEYGGRIYVAGGCSAGGCTTPLSTVQVATINSDGTLGVFATEDSFTTGRWGHTSIAFQDKLYIIGGLADVAEDCNDSATSAYCNDVQYATIASDGTISAFSPDSGTSFSTGRYSHASFIYNGYMYLVGGCIADVTARCAAGAPDIQYAMVNGDGSIGAWTTAQQNFTSDRFGHVSLAHAGFIYVIGGCTAEGLSGTTRTTCSAVNNAIQYQVINNGGSGQTSAWSNDITGTIAGGRGQGRVEVLNGYIYVMGGCSTGGTQTDCVATPAVVFAPISEDGSVGAWASATNGITARMNFASFTYNGRIYVLGGRSCVGGAFTVCNNNPTYPQTIQYATPDSDGNITTAWETNAVNLPTAFTDFSVTAYSGYVYRAGGGTGNPNSTAYASIDEDGEIGGWTPGTNLQTAVSLNTTLAYGGYLYSVAGNSAGSPTNIVQVAQIIGDGSIGAWSVSGNRMLSAAQWSCAAAYNGYMYRIAGSGDIAGTEFAPILPGGQIGKWQRATSLTTGRYCDGSPVWNGRVYMVTGLSGAAQSSAQEYATLESIPRIGSFSRAYDFDVGIKPTKLITRGTKQPGAIVNLNYRTTTDQPMFSSDVVFTLEDSFDRIISANHGFTGGEAITIQTTGTFPTGLTAGTYYVLGDAFLSSERFRFSATPGGSSVAFTGAGTGTHTYNTNTFLGNVPVFTNSQGVSDIGYFGSNALDLLLGTNTTLSRHLFLRYTIDDSYSAVFPDSDHQTTITDFDTYYTANPGNRLRGGRTFTNGADRGLDAQP